jgi:hypothetical protein
VKATFDALDVVHESGIVRGDVRCSNILVVKRRRGGVGSIDFGWTILEICPSLHSIDQSSSEDLEYVNFEDSVPVVGLVFVSKDFYSSLPGRRWARPWAPGNLPLCVDSVYSCQLQLR